MKTTLVVKHFDSLAASYDKIKQQNRLYLNTLTEAIKKEVTASKPTILDIGCGTGSLLYYLKPSYGIGLDISRQMVKIARTKYAKIKSLAFFTYDIEKKPYLGVFDYLLFIDVIEHISLPEKALKNISLSMKKETTFILSMANPFWEPLLLLLEKLGLKMPEGPHKRISERELESLFQKNNLEVMSKKAYLPYINFPYLKNLGLIYVYRVKKIQKIAP